jgi:hypothetical protein
MRRRLFNLAAAVSLGMMLAMTALWVRSFWQRDEVERRDARANRSLSLRAKSNKGLICLRAEQSQWPSSEGVLPSAINWRLATEPARTDFGTFWGFDWGTLTGRLFTVHYLSVPHWLFVVSCTAAPLTWLTQHRRVARRRTLQQCPSCGYDLRATRERCPECGTAVGTAVAPKPAETAA